MGGGECILTAKVSEVNLLSGIFLEFIPQVQHVLSVSFPLICLTPAHWDLSPPPPSPLAKRCRGSPHILGETYDDKFLKNNVLSVCLYLSL